MRRHSTAPLLALVTLGAALAGCGADTSEPGSAKGGEPAAFDVSTATVTDQPFCDQVDTTLVAAALGISADRVKLLESRKVGQKFEGPDEEHPKLTSDVNSCSFGSSTARFILTVRPGASSAGVQEEIDYYTNLGHKGFSSETCTVEDDDGFGDPGAVAGCHGTGGSKRTTVVATGLVGTSSYFCSAVLNTGGTPAMRDATVDACRHTLETLATVES